MNRMFGGQKWENRRIRELQAAPDGQSEGLNLGLYGIEELYRSQRLLGVRPDDQQMAVWEPRGVQNMSGELTDGMR